jgi:TolB-like protein/DNA-binding winged helix-turn-helix (wHTH) protein
MSGSDQRYVFGPFEMDVAESLLLRDSQPVPLTGKAFAVLAVLLERSGHLVEKQELLERVWPDAFVEEAVLSVNVAAIRRALGADCRSCIETVPKRGYRFVGEVRKVNGALAAPEPAAPEPAAVEPPLVAELEPTEAAPDSRRGARPLRWAALAATVVVVAVGIAGGAAWRSGRFARRPPPAPALGNSVAVLPLRSLSDEPAQQRFADAMTDLLITDLGRIGALKVVSRQSVLRYGHTQKTLSAIAQELKVDCIVEGTVWRQGQNVRITAQLIHGPTDRHLWAQSYDRNLGDTLALQEEVAETIAREVGIKISPAQVREAPHVAPAVYEAYLRGRYLLDQGKTDEAVAEFRRAVAVDPTYAAGYTKIASAYFDQAFFGDMPPKEAFPSMKEAALEAIELDDGDAEAHSWLAIEKLQYEWDWAGAEREFKRSLELNPSDSDVRHMYAHYLLTVGRSQESLTEMDRAFENDPVGLGAAT